VCNVDVPGTVNWLRLPHVVSPSANRIYVHVRFSVRQCVNFPNPAALRQCKVTRRMCARLFIYSFRALTLLVGRQEGHPACNNTQWWGAGVVICLGQGADLHMAQLMPLPLTRYLLLQ